MSALENMEIPYWVTAFTIASSFYMMVGWLGSKHLSQGAKEEVTAWLKGEYKSTWIIQFCKLFDAVFGKRHLSIQCFLRSSIASIFSIVLLYLIFGVILDFFNLESRAKEQLPIIKALLLGILLNIFPDYVSLYETRWLLKYFGKVENIFGQLAGLVLDAIFTGLIILVSINGYQFLSGEDIISPMKIIVVFSIYSVFFYSAFLTSVWAWLYFLSTQTMRIFSDTNLKKILAIEESPIEQIGLISSLLLFSFLMIVQPIVTRPNIESASLLEEFACTVSGDVCERLADDFTEYQEKAILYLSKACVGGEIEHCYKTAISYFDKNKTKAIELLDVGCEKDDPNSCYRLGRAFSEQEKFNDAVAPFKKTCEQNFVIGCLVLGQTYRELRKTKEAIEAFEKICNDKEVFGCYELGVIYSSIDEMDKAIEILERDCNVDFSEDPEIDEAYKDLCGTIGETANILRSFMKKRVAAEKSCEEGDVKSCIYVGLKYSAFGNVEKSEIFLKRGCLLNDLTACLYTIDLYDKSDMHDKAVAIIRHACRKNEMGRCDDYYQYIKAGNKSRLLDMLCQSGNFKGCFYAGVNSDKLNEEDKAKEYFSKACSGDSGYGCDGLGSLYKAKGDLVSAKRYYAKACKFNFMSGCYNLGIIHFQEKDFQEAHNFFEKACMGKDLFACRVKSILENGDVNEY